MKKLLIPTLLATLCSSQVQADNIGIYLGGHLWKEQAKGTFGSSNEQVDFNLKDQNQGSFFIAIEHPLPLIPNAKISSTTLETTGATTLESEFTFEDETFNVGVQATVDFDISYIDYTLYYELFDNDLVSFDVGLTGRDFDGDVSVSAQISSDTGTSTQSDSISISNIVPMLYIATNIGLPLTGLNLFAEGNLLSIDDYTLYDYQLGISYELIDNLAVDVNVNAGYRSVKLTVDDLDDLYTNLDFNGVFLGTTIHF